MFASGKPHLGPRQVLHDLLPLRLQGGQHARVLELGQLLLHQTEARHGQAGHAGLLLLLLRLLGLTPGSLLGTFFLRFLTLPLLVILDNLQVYKVWVGQPAARYIKVD